MATSYHVQLIGITWEGFPATHVLTFNHLPTDNEIRRSAGDFQDVADYSTVAITRTPHKDGWGYSERMKVIDHWQDAESGSLFADA